MLADGTYVPEVAMCPVCRRGVLRLDFSGMAARAGWTPPVLADLLAKVAEMTSSPWVPRVPAQ
jgi:hypothetical protein